MKLRKAITFLFAIAIFLCSSNLAVADGIGEAGNTIKIGSTQLKFKPEYDKKMRYNYNGHIFVKDYKEGQYGLFTPVKSGDPKPYLTMRRYLIENTQIGLGKNGEHLVGETWYKCQFKNPQLCAIKTPHFCLFLVYP